MSTDFETNMKAFVVGMNLQWTEKPTPSDVKNARLAAGLTQKQLADWLGYSRRTVQEWESGRRRMREVVFYVLQRHSKVSMSTDFLRNEET